MLTLSSAGMFGVFLFLTYYLQALLAYTPVRTGLAFLPMIGTLIAARSRPNVLVTRSGRGDAAAVMLASAAGMAMLTRLT